MVLEDPFLRLHFLPVQPYFYLSIFVFTPPNDGWTGLYIKLWCRDILWCYSDWWFCTSPTSINVPSTAMVLFWNNARFTMVYKFTKLVLISEKELSNSEGQITNELIRLEVNFYICQQIRGQASSSTSRQLLHRRGVGVVCTEWCSVISGEEF